MGDVSDDDNDAGSSSLLLDFMDDMEREEGHGLDGDDLLDVNNADNTPINAPPGESSSSIACNSSGGDTCNKPQLQPQGTPKSNTKKRRIRKKKKAAPSVPTESFEYITTDQLNRHDVLCGRGAGINTNPGNENFRNLIAARKDEYMSCGNDKAKKNDIARAICRHVRIELIPPGRFLKRAAKDQAAGWGFVEQQAAADVWVPVDEVTMLERAKQSLREKDVKYVDNIKQGKHHLKRKSGGDGGCRRPKENDGDTHTASVGSSANNSFSRTLYMGSDAAIAGDSISMTGGAALGSIAIPKQTHQQDQQQQQTFENGNIWPQHHHQPHSSQAFGQPARAAAAPLNPATDGALTNANASSTFGWYEPSTIHVPNLSTSPDKFSLDLTRGGSVGLKDWISAEMIRAMSLHGSQVQEADRYYQLQAAKLALTLLQTVQMYHENGIAFGGCGIGSDTIRVLKNVGATADEAGSSSAVYSVAITSTAPQSTSEFDDDIKLDLVNVGTVLYELFSGIPPFQNQEDTDLFDALAAAVDVETDDSASGAPSKRRRERASTAASSGSDCIPLRDLGLPVAIDELVKSLMNLKEDSVSDRSKQTADFVGDIQLMINDPDRCLFDIEDDTAEARYEWVQAGYRLEFPQGKLYGRDEETARLVSAFGRVICKGERTEAVTVSGYSGIGKTSLVLQLCQPTIERGGFFVSGKFDTLRQAKPLSAIANALDAFCDDVVARYDGTEQCDAIQSVIQDAIGDGADTIASLIPNLWKILGSKKRRDSVSDDIEIDTNALNRLIYLFRRFFGAIASPSHPVVLFIDDLQWADTMSLDLIREIACSSDVRSFLFVGSYRSNEVDQNHPLVAQLSQIQGAGVPMLNIELSNMSKTSINALVSDTLKLSPLLTRPLSDAVYSKTSGNCLFVVELLSDLHRQNLLRYSVSSRRWEWDDDTIAALEIKSNVVDLMRRKLLRLSATEMWSVKVVACLGAQTKKTTLDLLSQGLGLAPENGLATLLLRPVDEGLLIKAGSSYRFSHDQIQDAAYSLVTVGDRPSFHLKLGQSLVKGAAAGEGLQEEVLLTCVDQLNRGSPEISDHSEKLFSAQLNLQAAKNAIASSTFLSASIYLRFAKKYLVENDWQNNYDLCLEIYSTLSESEYVTGEYEEMTAGVNEILLRARTFDDKLRAYYTLIRANAAQNCLNMAASTCFQVLGELGESFENDIDPSLILQECLSIKTMLEGKDKDWFMTQNLMTDSRTLNAMKFMNVLLFYLYCNDVLKLPLVICRMIRLTMEYGLCKVSATAFGAYGVVCCGFLGDYAEGYRVGKIATAIIGELNAQELVAQSNAMVCASINAWTEPLQSTLPIAAAGYDAGISAGDPEYAMLCRQVHTTSSFLCGQSLDGIVEDLSQWTKECKQYRMDLIILVILPLWQCIENLIDISVPDPTHLDGEILQQGLSLEGVSFIEALASRNREGMYGTAICQYYLYRLTLAYTFGHDELAAEMYDKCIESELEKKMFARPTLCACAFYGGLAALSMERKDRNNPKWRGIVDAVIPRMEKWAEASAWNFEHKLLFLKAEQMTNAGDQLGAVAAYEGAIRLAREHRFVNEEALIADRYSKFLLAAGEKLSAEVQCNNAYEAYKNWGALRKCKEMKQNENI